MTPGHVRGELTVRDVLMRTKRLFTSGQWTQGTMHNQHVVDGKLVDQFCLVGGLRHTSDYQHGQTEVYLTASVLLAETIMGDDVKVSSAKNVMINFNDSRKSVDEVVELIDEAVAKLDSA